MTRNTMGKIWITAACTAALLSACEPEDNNPPTSTLDGAVSAADASTPNDAGAVDARIVIDSSAPSDGAVEATTPAVDAGRDAAPSGDAGGDAASGDALENLRQVCVDTINQHRATLSLPPLTRASKTQETCSDQGAKKDGDSNVAHGSAGSCSGLGAQDTCPAWKFGPGTGNATLEAALKRCLQAMWDEGMPPVSVKACIADKACFPKYGHWINMSSTDSHIVSCGFYDMGKNTYWMNQDFGR